MPETIPPGTLCRLDTKGLPPTHLHQEPLWAKHHGQLVTIASADHPFYGVRFQDGSVGRCTATELQPEGEL